MEVAVAVVAISMIANEADMIEASIRNNRAYFDCHYVVCNPSCDGTEKILSALISEGLPIVPIFRPINRYSQDDILSSLYLRVLDIHNDCSIMVLDADEFIVGGTKDELELEIAGLPPGHVAYLKWRTHLPPEECAETAFPGAGVRPFARCLRSEPFTLGKVIRPPFLAVHSEGPVPRGTHAIVGPDGLDLPTQELRNFRVAHVPVRSRGQIARKVVLGWTAKCLSTPGGLSEMENRHWIEIAQKIRTGAATAMDLVSIAVNYSGLGYTPSQVRPEDIELDTRPLPEWKIQYSKYAVCQRRRKTRPLGGAKPGQYSRHAGKRREGVARAVLACVRGDFRRSVQAVWPDFRALLWARR